MPEYLAPGVYVEEVSFRQKTIEGVSTSTAGFIGPTRFGPIFGPPPLLSSFLDFERIYGGLDLLDFEGTLTNNYVAHAVRAFFENGGSRLYVARAFEHADDTPEDWEAHGVDTIGSPVDITLFARYPGEAGNFNVTFDFRVGPNIFGTDDGLGSLRGAQPGDVVLLTSTASPPGASALHWLERAFDPVAEVDTFRLRTDTADSEPTATLATNLSAVDVRVVTVNVTIGGMGRFMSELFWEGLAFHPTHRQSLQRVFAEDPINRFAALNVPLVVDTDLTSGIDILEALLEPVIQNDTASPPLTDAIDLVTRFIEDPTQAIRLQRRLEGGSDGERPGASAYEGDTDTDGNASGLLAFEEIDDISIVASPGSTADAREDYEPEYETIQQLVISHCERMRYRIGVLDSRDGALVGEIREDRGVIDSKYAALYYPWVTIMDPVTEAEIVAPPSGFVAGIYARNDVERGVHKAPANEIVRLAIDFETRLNKAQQDVLNPEGVNCLRFFQGRGFRVWGARTVTSDPEWKYVNLRRYFAFLEHSVDKGTQWAVFEPNGRLLWDNVRRTVEDFLFAEWKGGHLLGDKPEEAYFVKCDLTTMTQSDLDNGRLVCLVGVAPLRPAEFVIFRIGQKTLTSRN